MGMIDNSGNRQAVSMTEMERDRRVKRLHCLSMALAFAVGAIWIGLVDSFPAMAQDNDCVEITEKAWRFGRAGGFDGCGLVEQLAPYCVAICKQLVLLDASPPYGWSCKRQGFFGMDVSSDGNAGPCRRLVHR